MKKWSYIRATGYVGATENAELDIARPDNAAPDQT